MVQLAVLIPQQPVGFYEAGIKLNLCFHIFGNDIRKRNKPPVHRLIHIVQIVHHAVRAVAVFREDFQIVVLVVVKTCADDGQEQVALFLFFDQTFQPVLVRNTEIQVAVRDQDHLVVPVRFVKLLPDIIRRVNSGGSIGTTLNLNSENNAHQVFFGLFVLNLETFKVSMVFRTVGNQADAVAGFELAEHGRNGFLGHFIIRTHAARRIQEQDDVLMFLFLFGCLCVNEQDLFVPFLFHQFGADGKLGIFRRFRFIIEIIEYFLNAHLIHVDATPGPDLVKYNSHGCIAGGHPERGCRRCKHVLRILFFNGFVRIRG